MKKSLSKKKKLSKIPKSKINKTNLEFSIKGLVRISKIKNDSNNKDTIDGSCVDNQTLAFNQDSVNNSKGTINKNNSLSRFDNKLIIFSSSLKNDNDKNNKLSNISKRLKIKTSPDFLAENISSCDEDTFNKYVIKINNNNEIIENESDEEDTNRIDYRYYPKIPEIESNKENKYFWLATYDKLMKKSKIIKILNYYTELSPKNSSKSILINDENKDKKDLIEKYNFTEKCLIIEGYEIYFLQKFNKPFIRPKKGGKVFIKLYLLNIEQLNKIFSYINRLEYKPYINNMSTIKEKNYFKILSKSNKTIYNYSTIFYIGSFVNINIYLFSHIEKVKNKVNKWPFNINDFPSSHKLAKLIKILLINFPDYSKDYFIDYLLEPIKKNFELNNGDKKLLNKKKNEISSLLISNHKESLKINKRNKKSANSVIKHVIQKIPTYSQSSFKTPDEFKSLSGQNISSILKDKSNNKTNNNEINIFSSNYLNTKNINPQKSEKIFEKIENNLFNNNNNLNLARKTQSNKNYKNLTNRLLKNDTLKRIDNFSHSIKQIKLIDKKKSLTRYNTNRTYFQFKPNKTVKYSKSNRSNRIISDIVDFKKDKENNQNIFNSNTFESIRNSHLFKSDYVLTKKNTRNKNKFNPFNLINTNSNKENIIIKESSNKCYKNPPIRLLSSLRKVISQRINNIPGNISSININMNLSNSNSSYIGNKYFFQNNESNNNSNYKKLVCKTNNNGPIKRSEYITPTRKKFSYYYH